MRYRNQDPRKSAMYTTASAIRPEKGFTLLELMIVVVIIGIIAAIGYPSYTQHLLKTRRADAQRALTDLANRLDRYYVNRAGIAAPTYTTDMTLLSYTQATKVSIGRYELAVAACAGGTIATCYALTATAIDSQKKDTLCPALSLQSSGAKTPIVCW